MTLPRSIPEHPRWKQGAPGAETQLALGGVFEDEERRERAWVWEEGGDFSSQSACCRVPRGSARPRLTGSCSPQEPLRHAT